MFKKQIIRHMQEKEQTAAKENESSIPASSCNAISGINSDTVEDKRRSSVDECKQQNTKPPTRKLVKKKKKPAYMDEYLHLNDTIAKLEIENNLLVEQRKESQNKYASLKSSLKLKKNRISELKRSVEEMRLEMNKLRKVNFHLSALLKANIKKNTYLFSQTNKLKRMKNILQQKIKRLKEQKQEKDTRLQNANEASEKCFNSSIDQNFAQTNSPLINDVQRLSESNSRYDNSADIDDITESNSHLDKNIQHCPTIAYMNSAEITRASQSIIGNNELDNGPPPKRSKTDKNTMENYDKASLKELVMNLELRHRKEYHLWRNVLWALKEYGVESGCDTFEIAYDFSRRSTNYKDFEDVKKTFESSDGTKSLQYLIDISKIYEEGLKTLAMYLNTIMPEEFLPLLVKQVDIRDRSKIRLTVQCADESFVLFIIPHLYVLTTQNGKRLNFLQSKIVSKSSALASLCAEMKEGYTATLNPEQYEFRAKRKTLILNHPLDVQNAFITYPNGKNGKKTLDLRTIRTALREEALKLLTKMSGKPFDDDNNDYIQDANGLEPNAKRSDMDLMNALFDADPDLRSRYRSTGNAIYHCNLETNLWYKLGEKTFDCHLVKYFNNTVKLTHAELQYINKKIAITKLRHLFLGEVENLTFDDKLNSNLQLFVTTNRTIDASNIPPTIRRIEVEDLAEITSGWSYNSELAAKYKDSVQSYFDKLFPIQNERDWVLSFLAQMLNGERMDRLFLILFTDEREGKTGKTTLKSLLRAVFGTYYLANSKVVVHRGSQDRNNYDGGMYSLKEKRLLVADDLQKTDNLNCGFIKAITGESNYRIREKKYRSAQEYEFTVQASLVILCTENNIPKFDKTDKDFLKRLVACPLRSRFVNEEEFAELHTPHTYIVDDSIKTQIPEWRSATLDLLIKYYRKSVPPIPDSMADCKRRMSELYRDYADWLDAHIYKSQSADAFVTATQIITRLNKPKEYFNPYEIRKLKSDMAEWAARNDYEYKARYVYKGKNGRRHEAKSAILNAAFELSPEE